MKHILFILPLFALVACQSTQTSTTTKGDVLPLQDQSKAPQTIKVTSSSFQAGQAIETRFSFNQFGCVGQNTAPKIAWSGAPANTKSYVLIAHDPDAPTGVGFFHWLVINLPATTTSIDGTLPETARELRNDYGAFGYGGPCPPKGRNHRYVFSVYALDVPSLPLPREATGALVRFMLLKHAIARGRVTGTFAR